jgi:hypothetical protein
VYVRLQPRIKGFTFCLFSLYVRVAVLNSAHTRLESKLCFGNALFSGFCFGVQYTFLRTRPTCVYVESVGMCMCKHVSTAFFLHKNQRTAMISAMRSGTSMAHSVTNRPQKPSASRPYKQFYQNKSTKENALSSTTNTSAA